MTDKSRPFIGSLKGKIVIAFLLGAGAVGLTLVTTYLSLNKMLFVVDDLTEPNTKLNKLNNLYRRVTRLEQQQRLDALIHTSKSDRDFLSESNSIQLSLDSLLAMPWSSPKQKERILEMRKIIHERDGDFLQYLKLKSNAIRNKKLAKQFDSLNQMLSRSYAASDSSVRTTEKRKTTIRYLQDSIVVPPAEPKRSFFSRLFKRKSAARVIQLPKTKITEEVNVKVDTLAIAHRNTKLAEVSQILNDLEKNELSRRYKLAGRELALLKLTNTLLNQMIETLRQVEEEEVMAIGIDNASAQKVFNNSVSNLMIILLVFSLVAATLIYIILIDITRSNYYKEELLRAKNQAEELTLVKDRFLSNMSHEIRTPLQSIIGFSEQMLAPSVDDYKKKVNAIYSSSQHLLHIVNEVLDYNRLESGKFRLDHEKFYLLEMAEEVAASIQVQAERKGLSFVTDFDSSKNEYVIGDPFRLKQILYNLLGNAVKFTNRGSIRFNVSAVEIDKKVTCTFEIVDTGIGMTPEELKRVFHRFEQANTSITSHFGGTGLGLSIVEKLVEVFAGKLEVASNPGEGTRFRVVVTLDKAEGATDAAADLTKQTKPFHVLVVDDDPLILQLCKLILQGHKVRATLCANPRELYDHAVSSSITHVLMDIRMGNANGLELGKIIRERVEAGVQLIAMSAHLPDDPDSLTKYGFDAILRKPFNQEELCRTILGEYGRDLGLSWEGHFSQVRNMAMNDEALLQSVLIAFVQETESDLALLRVALKNRDLETIVSIVHKLAGRTGQMGFLSLSTRLLQMEDHLRNEATIEPFSVQLEQLCESIADGIDEARLSALAN